MKECEYSGEGELVTTWAETEIERRDHIYEDQIWILYISLSAKLEALKLI